MKPEQLELLRNAILLQLEAADPASLPTATLLQGVRLAGHDIDTQALEKEMRYLRERQLLTETRRSISQAIPRFLISANGRDYLEENHLV